VNCLFDLARGQRVASRERLAERLALRGRVESCRREMQHWWLKYEGLGLEGLVSDSG
jgi:hypothetical protein